MLEAIANIETDTAGYDFERLRLPWRAVAGIGNVPRHDYHESYPTILWDTCEKDLKQLEE